MKDIFRQTVELENQTLKLLPMAATYLDDLCNIAFDNDCWRYMETRIDDKRQLESYINNAMDERGRQETYWFALGWSET